MFTAASGSAVALHFQRKRVLSDVEEVDMFENIESTDIVKSDEILDKLFNIPPVERHIKARILPQLQPHLKKFYFEKIHYDIDSVKHIARKTIGQCNNLWKIERRKRITASDAYKLYTYSRNKQPKWQEIISDYLHPKNYKSPAMQYGSFTEKEAFSAYETNFKCQINRLGFVISPITPWLGASVDGFIPNLRKTVEFKCPFVGASKDISQVLPTLKYLDENQCLKINHTYYCQVQLGMAVLNATNCDFVVYCKYKQQLHVINIPFHQTSVDKYMSVLSSVFFKFILPTIHDV